MCLEWTEIPESSNLGPQESFGVYSDEFVKEGANADESDAIQPLKDQIKEARIERKCPSGPVRVF